MLNITLGDRVMLDGRAHLLGRPGVVGHLVFGPYEELVAGRYTVQFELHVWGDKPNDLDAACAIVDVCADLGKSEIASATVYLRELVEGQNTITLGFHLENTAVVEYRIHSEGQAQLLVADLPQVSLLYKPNGNSDTLTPDFTEPASSILLAEIKRYVEAMDRKQEYRFRSIDRRLQRFTGDGRQDVARQIVDALGWRGDNENSLYRAFVGTDQPIALSPQPVPFTSSLCQQSHFVLDQYRFWARALKEAPRFSRKQWEFIYIAQALHERGLLAPGSRGIVFGAGQEPLPALFASFGVKVLATDQEADTAVNGGWIESGQHSYDLAALNRHGICTDRMFSELVSFQPVDMNAIPTHLDGCFDFCWSACALEHLGSIDHGLQFIRNSVRTLRPGGVAIHTTEYNLSSNSDTVETSNLCLYRRCDIEAFYDQMKDEGVAVEPIDWTLGEGFAETVIDLPPFLGRGEPHIRLRAGEFDTTSIGLILTAPAA